MIAGPELVISPAPHLADAVMMPRCIVVDLRLSAGMQQSCHMRKLGERRSSEQAPTRLLLAVRGCGVKAWSCYGDEQEDRARTNGVS